jgi:hypothetical protein
MEQTTKGRVTYDEDKFIELILYVASRLAGDSSYGSVKLNKALFFSDFLHYASYGSAISGVEYVKHPLGPAPRGISVLQERLIERGDADLAILRGSGRAQKLLFAKREPKLELFKGTEIATVDDVLAAFKGHSMPEVSEASHALLAWKVAPERATIPYEAIFLYDGPITEEDVTHAQTVAKKLRSDLERAGVFGAAA